MSLYLSAAPAVEPVSLTEIKAQCRIDISTDDTLLASYVKAARRKVESLSRHVLIEQTWKLYLDDWPAGDTIVIPVVPLMSVTSVKYTDKDGTVATLSSSTYVVDIYSKPARIRLKSDQSWPGTTLQVLNGIVVEFKAGFGDDSTDVPDELCHAVKLLAAHWYENREAIATSGAMPKEIPFTVTNLCREYAAQADRR